ncbi:hypothetical protein ACOSP7_003465 [Xanthoceras sorbifolium]
MSKLIIMFRKILQVKTIISSNPKTVAVTASVKKCFVFPEHIEISMEFFALFRTPVAPVNRSVKEFPLKLSPRRQILHAKIYVAGLAVHQQSHPMAHPIHDMHVPCLSVYWGVRKPTG